MSNYYPLADVEAYIRAAAAKRGMDPDIAVRVAKSEGLAPNTWQSRVPTKNGHETSYGPYQLLVGGGLGDTFKRQTGLDPSDPSTVYQQVDFALDQASQGGWSPWYGAAKVGVGNWDGIRKGSYTPAPQAPQPNLKPNDMPPGLLSGIGSPNNPQLQPQSQPMMAQGGDAWGGMRTAATPSPTGGTNLASAISALQTLLENQGQEQQQMQLPPPPEPHRPGAYTPPQMLSLLAPGAYR